MSIADALAAHAYATPVATHSSKLDPTELRRQRGLAIAAVTRIVRAKGREERWIVPSQSGQDKYTVSLVASPATCDCEDFTKRQLPCKHIFAVEVAKARGDAPPAEVAAQLRPSGARDYDAPVPPPERTCAPRKTYKQDWPAYNTAQIHEKERFQGLLHDLCGGIPSPNANPKGGRPPLPMGDRAFACAFKVYTTISGRRASTDMRDTCDKGHLSKAPHYSAVARYLEDPAMTPILIVHHPFCKFARS